MGLVEVKEDLLSPVILEPLWIQKKKKSERTYFTEN